MQNISTPCCWSLLQEETKDHVCGCFWALKSGLTTMKTKPHRQKGLEAHQNIFIRLFQAGFRGKRNNLLAAGMHFRVFEPKSQLKSQNIAGWALLISITGPKNICQCQLQWGTLHSLTDLRKLIKYRREITHYGQSSSGLLGTRTLPPTDSMGQENSIELGYLCNCKAGQSQAL